MEEDEDDIWDYKSIKKVKRSEGKPKRGAKYHQKNLAIKQPSNSSQDKGKRKTPTKVRKRQKTPQKKNKESSSLTKTNQTPTRPQGVCPNCQVPLACLGILSPTWHVTECIEAWLQPTVDCPEGLSCDSTIENHYREFSHHRLALARCTNLTKSEECTENQEENKIARKELKFPEEFVPNLKKISTAEEVGSEVKDDNRSDAESEDLLSQRSLSDILDAVQSDSDIDKVSSDEGSDENEDEGLVSSLLPDEDGDSLQAESTLCFSTEEDELKDLQKLESQDIFGNYDNTLCFSSQDETFGKNETCKQNEKTQNSKRKSSSPVKISPRKKNKTHEKKSDDVLFSSDKDGKQLDNLVMENTSCLKTQKSGGTKNSLSKEEVCLYISDSDSDFKDCESSASLSQKMQWARILTPQKCSQNSGSSQKHSGRKSLSQKSTSSKKSSAKKRKSLPANSMTSQKSEEKKNGLPPKPNSGKKRKEQSDIKITSDCNSALKIHSKTQGKRSQSVTTTQDISVMNGHKSNKQTSLTSFFYGKNVRSSASGTSVQQQVTFTSIVSDSDMETCTLITESSEFVTSRVSRSALDEVTNKVNSSTCQEAVPSQEGIGGLRRSQRKLGDSKTIIDKKNSSNTVVTNISSGMGSGFGSLKTRPTKLGNMDSQITNKNLAVESSKPNAMEFLMSKQDRKSKPKAVEKSVKEVKVSELTIPSAEGQQSKPSSYSKKNCPFYKKIPDTGFTVDAFSYGVIPGCRGYILSHFHYDHYIGMTKSFSQPIYCSKITANLVISKIKVNESNVHALPMNKPCVVDGVELTFLEANHCPGSVLILFKLKDGRVFLHTGDFRADPSMEKYPPLVGVRISQLYLDTTYCNPTYAFPSQREVIEFTVNLVQNELQRNPKTLIVCGSYTIGKERVFIAVAEALKCKICVLRDKKNILDCLEDDSLRKKLSLNFNDSCLHVLPMGKLKPKALMEHSEKLTVQYQNILALEPTGWTFSKINSLQEIRPKYNRDGIKIYGIPYSEHSSYLELERFVQFIKPSKIIPTVNVGNPASRAKMNKIFQQWQQQTPKAVKKNTQTSISSWAM
ncbi:DNA cross-link repair 1A protein-like [Saccostrea echinata]|uniref:DNA cross-link repair 1A protein-like n=1 Tax=Saccostrea echinata TaxID=191078 RepID=UPI002A7FBAA6|nr:DNA cross-link repair 1A protein-like [Saccostrea echinata]